MVIFHCYVSSPEGMEVVRTSKTNERLWLFLTLLLPSIALRKSNIETEAIKWIVFLKPASFQIFPVSMDWLKFTAPWENGWYGWFPVSSVDFPLKQLQPLQDEMTSLDYSERRISLDMTPLSCKSTDSSAECLGGMTGRRIFSWA